MSYGRETDVNIDGDVQRSVVCEPYLDDKQQLIL
jgi:hypothetical protein